jgi:outer membrane protein assembly factor BamB
MVALDLASGRILWDTKLSQMADRDATVANDLVFTTTFHGYVVALSRKDDSLAWKKKLPGRQVTNGGGGMRAFGGRLTKAQIEAVANYVSSVAGK